MRRALIAGILTFVSVALPSIAQNADAKLDAFFRAYLEESFRERPTEATGLGDHRYDSQLDDISPAARAGWKPRMRQELAALPKTVKYSELSRDGQIDYEIFRDDLIRGLWLTKNTHPFEEDPRTYGGYLNDSVYLLVAQSTLPKETNIANAIARMEQMPRII